MSDLATQDLLLPLPELPGRYQVRVRVGTPSGPVLPLAFEPWLYLTPGYQTLAPAATRSWLCCLEDLKLQRTVSWLRIFADEAARVGRSAYQAPFGGIQVSAGLPTRIIHGFIREVHAQLNPLGLEHLEITSAPEAYDPANAARLAQALTSLGYTITQAEVNYHLPLTRDFAGGLHSSERRRLRKCQQAGMRFEQEPPLLLPAAYAFLLRCRQEKGQHFSMELARLQALFRCFPREYFLFSVRDAQGEWAALTVAVRVNSRVLYNFSPASPMAYNGYSPVVLLNAGLHAFGRANEMTLLDLGTSMLPQAPNFSLLQFKEHLGGVPSLKYTFRR